MAAPKALTLDLTNYKDRRGSRVEEGKYLVTIEDVEQNTSNAGNPYVTVWLRILDEGTHNGETILDRLTLTEKSLWRVVAFLQAIGVPTPRKRIQIPFQSLVGRRLTIEVADGDPYNGTVRSEVRGYFKPPAAAGNSNGSAGGDLADLGEAPAPEDVSTPPPAETVEVPAQQASEAPASEDEAEVSIDVGGVNLDEVEL